MTLDQPTLSPHSRLFSTLSPLPSAFITSARSVVPISSVLLSPLYPTVPRSSSISEPVDLQDRLLDALLAELYDGGDD